MASNICAIKNKQRSSTTGRLDRTIWQPSSLRWIKINSNGDIGRDEEWTMTTSILCAPTGNGLLITKDLLAKGRV